MEVFRYRLKTIAAPFVAGIPGLFVFSVLPFFLVGRGQIHHFGDFPLIAKLCLLWLPAIGCAALIFNIRRWRPIGVDDFGVRAYFFGRPIKIIPWKSITIIERRRQFDPVFSGYRHVYFIRNPETYIRFEDGLNNLDDLLREINERARKHGIDLLEVDRGLDVRRKLLPALTDSEQRRDLIKFGARKRLNSL
ncbi:hypothetical protein [Aerococcus loyolae]|uniref:Uncharacterized protein n=1 Tax=Aerococcus urinae TaxID=1376 RepID=A0A329P1F4_9LACT|nr:hypothetical protein DBT54_09835 [Aerococcus loyolae]